tara:strand:- start:4497 stop:5357 length:861 start_codon:yes stop_codon:yes gene_type:complete
MKILITGAGTLIGNTLTQKLLSTKNNIYATYYKTYPKNLKNSKNLKIFKMNLEKPQLKMKEVDIIVHCASAIPDYQFDKKKMLNINFEGFKKIIKKFPNVRHVIILSTVSIYGKINDKVITEKSKIHKQDDYGKSKYLMEKFLIKDSKRNNYNYTILRLPGVVGKNSQHNFLSNFVIKLKNNIKNFLLFNPKMLFNNVIHTETLTNVIKYIIKNKINGIYLLGSSDPIKLEIIFNMVKKFKQNINLNFEKNNSGFRINVNKAISKKLPLISTRKTIYKFYKENLIN